MAPAELAACGHRAAGARRRPPPQRPRRTAAAGARCTPGRPRPARRPPPGGSTAAPSPDGRLGRPRAAQRHRASAGHAHPVHPGVDLHVHRRAAPAAGGRRGQRPASPAPVTVGVRPSGHRVGRGVGRRLGEEQDRGGRCPPGAARPPLRRWPRPASRPRPRARRGPRRPPRGRSRRPSPPRTGRPARDHAAEHRRRCGATAPRSTSAQAGRQRSTSATGPPDGLGRARPATSGGQVLGHQPLRRPPGAGPAVDVGAERGRLGRGTPRARRRRSPPTARPRCPPVARRGLPAAASRTRPVGDRRHRGERALQQHHRPGRAGQPAGRGHPVGPGAPRPGGRTRRRGG